MNVPAWQAAIAAPILAGIGKWFPYLRYPGLSPLYAQSIHADHHGQWKFRQDWKPIAGFPVYAGWFRAIHRAQAEVARGLRLECPCLVLHSQRSRRLTSWSTEAQSSDIVLNIADIQRLAPGLGPQVEIHAITDGMHDLVLSDDAARNQMWKLLSDWLQRIRSG